MNQMNRPFHVMVKPNGPRCNLACTYCYYLDKEKLYRQTKKFRMADAVLEVFIRDYIASQSAQGLREIVFSWQGGEPTILGLAYFRRIVALQQKYAPKDKIITNALQTNGLLLDEAWAAFFKAHDFLVGLSIDGPRHLHDSYRVDKQGRGTFDQVIKAYHLLKAHQVMVNALTVVHAQNAQSPLETYHFLRDAGFEFMQFIPLVERSTQSGTLAGADEAGRVTAWSVTPEDYGNFLIAIFDEWQKEDIGRVYVQLFDVLLGLWVGQPAGLCWFAPTCGQGLALEHNGDLFACDHYVYPSYRLGNITQTPLATLAKSPAQIAFGQNKQTSLPRTCQQCRYLFACHGGCPKHRFLTTPEGEDGLNYFCAAYLAFFAHAAPRFQKMAALLL